MWYDFDLEAEKPFAAYQARAAARQARKRVVCGAKTRKGRPCRLMSVPGKARCKFHGGLSTGPTTSVGRERIAEAQRRRWAKWRVEQEIAEVQKAK